MTFDTTFTSNSHSNNTGLPKKIVVGGAIALLLGVACYYSNGVLNGVALEDQSSVPTAADGVKEVDATAWLTGGDASDFFGIVDSSITIPAFDDPTPKSEDKDNASDFSGIDDSSIVIPAFDDPTSFDIIEVVDDGGPSTQSCTTLGSKPRMCRGSREKFARFCYDGCNAECGCGGALQQNCMRLCQNRCVIASDRHGGSNTGAPSMTVRRRPPSNCNPLCSVVCLNHLLLPGIPFACDGRKTWPFGRHPDITCNKDEVYQDCNFNRNCWARYATGWTCGLTSDPVYD